MSVCLEQYDGTYWWARVKAQGKLLAFSPHLFIFHFLPWNAKTSSFPSMGFVLQFCYRLKELWMSSFKSSIRFLWIVIWWSQQHHFSPLVPSRVHVIYIYIYIYLLGCRRYRSGFTFSVLNSIHLQQTFRLKHKNKKKRVTGKWKIFLNS